MYTSVNYLKKVLEQRNALTFNVGVEFFIVYQS